MNYIKFFDNKIKEELDKNNKYQELKSAVDNINAEIDSLQKVYPLVFRSDMSFADLVNESRSFAQSYAERDDEYDKYDYKISQSFYDKAQAGRWSEAKANAVKYFDQLGEFLKNYSCSKLENMQATLNRNNKEMKAIEDNTVKKVIVEQISSPELTSFINDFLKGDLPKELGETGAKIKNVISEEYNVMKEEDFKLRQQIQNKIQSVDNEKEDA